MSKYYTFLTGILLMLMVSTCKQFTEGIDEYLSYWASDAFIKSATIEAAHSHDKDGITSVASYKDVEITLRLQNPQSFRFVMPSAAEKRPIVDFTHLSDLKPAVTADYEMTQPTADTLRLTYKAAFLQKAEWGEKDLSSVITLYAVDGRPFKRPYTVQLKANTPPPQITHYSVAKTKGRPAHYVLCLIVPEMDQKVPGGLLHKDIASITVNGTSYALSVSEAQKAFVTPEGGAFVEHTAIEKLAGADADEVPASNAGNWIVYYKTDVEVAEGSAKKSYTVQLADAKALVSPALQASTKPNKPKPATVSISKGEKADTVSGDGSSEVNAVVIKAGTGEPEAELTMTTPTSAAKVYSTVTDIRSGSLEKYEGNPIKIPLALHGTPEKSFKVSSYVSGDGFIPTIIKTVYYNVVRSNTVTFDANGGAYKDGSMKAIKTTLHGQKIAALSVTERPEKTGHFLAGWTTDQEGSREWNFETPVTSDMTLYAKWGAASGTAYKVEHYRQNLDDNGYTIVNEDTQSLHGKSGAAITVMHRTYTGFTYEKQEPAAPTIAADGTTVVKVYYKRRIYPVSYNVVGGAGGRGSISVTAITGGTAGASPVMVRHGGSVTFTATPDNGWEVDSWTVSPGAFASGGGTGTTATLSNISGSPTVTVKFKPGTLTFAAGSDAWKKLKAEAAKTEGAHTIVIDGEIKATDESGNNGEITLGRNLTIKGKTGKDSDILNANKNEGGKSAHRIFKVEADKTLTLKNLTLTGGIVDEFGEPGGGAIYAEGPLTMMNCIVTGNRITSNNGGGICAGSTLTMTDCTVTQNIADDTDGWGGGGIYAVGTLTMTNCSITNNRTLCNGGGVYAEGTLSMTGCTISENKTKYRNTGASEGSGGGIYAKKNCTMTGGSVSNNEAKVNGNGGGIYIGGTGSFTMMSGTVNNNKTEHGDGGGIYSEGTLTMTGGTLTDNKAVHNKTGGGVYVNGTFTMKGASCVTPSTDNAKGNNDVYLADGKMITIDGVLSPAGGIAARITVAHIKYLPTTQVLTGSKVNTEHDKFTVTPKDLSGGITQQWKITNNGFLQRPPVTINGSEGGAWKKLKAAVQAAEDGDIISISGTITATNTGSGSNANFGKIDITKNITIEKADGAPPAVLNANRGSLGSNAHPIFRVSDGKTLKLKNLTLKGGKGISGTFGGAINVTGGGSKTELEDCVIEDCEADKGGAIGCGSGTTVTLTNTTIQNCKTTGTNGTGGAIYTEGGTVTMTSGTLTGNTAKSGGGVYLKDGTFTMQGSSCVTPSTDNAKGNNDVYLADGKMITISGTLTPPNGKAARITVADEKYLPTTQVLTGSKVNTEYTKFSVTPKSGTPLEYWGINNTGNLTQDKAAILNTISKEQIQAAESSMNNTTITDRKTNLLNKLILYKTNLNNYGIMRVTAVDNTEAGYIRIDYKTFNSDGSIKKSENNRKVNGTYPFDLDKGIDSGGDFDFWLENLNSTDAGRLFKPANGAKFYVLP